MRFTTGGADATDAAALIAAMRDEMRELYSGLDIDEAAMPSAAPGDFATFLVGYEDERPVCGGGLKPLEPGVVEIKRMFVVPDARGRGVARALLAELEAEAARRGFETVRLDTGPRQPSAERMYREAGYAEIANFNANPIASFFGEKRL